MHPSPGLADLVEDVRVLADMHDAVERSLPPIQVVASYTRMVARACLHEHVERLRASLVLMDGGVPAQVIALVRPALDQMLWLRYLGTLSEEDREELLRLVGFMEITGTLIAQQNYAGKRVMTQLGFPAVFVKDMTKERKEAKAELAVLGARLGWDVLDGEVQMPNSQWVAHRVDRPRTYDLLFGPMSKPLHFSVSEATRRLWGELDGAASLDDPSYLTWRAALALYELALLTPEIVVAVAVLTPEDYTDDTEVDIDLEATEAAMERIKARGNVPIVTPQTFNLHKIDYRAMKQEQEAAKRIPQHRRR